MSFPLAGNTKIALAVNNALREHRLPHAILIDGDIGTGKHTLARLLSKAAVCNGKSIPCEECHDCHLARLGNHPDIKIIAPEEGKKSISVSQIRQLKADAYIKPHQGHSKVFVIDFADTLNEQSQNALLKVLEEPPKSTVFILIAESKASLLETVLSRCVALSLNVPTLSEGLSYISSVVDYSEADIKKTLEDGNNNIGKALLLLKGKADTKTSLIAREFWSFALSGDQWGMLTALAPLEKSRVETDRFFKDLKLLVASEIKKNPKSVRASSLYEFYKGLFQFEQSLFTNINLSLLFSRLTSQAKKLII